MAKYLSQSNYSIDGLKGLLKEGGSKRREAVEKLIFSLGGKIESFYYAFGGTDLFMICDMPDNVSTAAASLIVNATGAASTKITVLLTPEEVDKATKMTANYRPPGK